MVELPALRALLVDFSIQVTADEAAGAPVKSAPQLSSASRFEHHFTKCRYTRPQTPYYSRPMMLLIFALTLTAAIAADGPNVLWITLEDTSPQFIGCYGNESARTPNIDRLAARGVRFDSAFANAPVCSSARSTLITGALNETLGTGNHRSAFPLPDSIKGFPTFLRAAGYHTTNNAKTDYATSSSDRLIKESWNESSNQAGWWQRQPDQPFFAVFNQEDCHQSRTMTQPYSWYLTHVFQKLKTEDRIADDAFPLPPFIPDTPEFRKHFARVYNSIALADEKVGKLLDRLDADNLTEDTIIFCYADHGEAMLRGKTNPIGLGYRVPFIIVFPTKWQHLNPWGKPGTATDELICFDDLGPTLLSLVDQKPAPWMTGRPLLGSHRAPPKPYIFCSRNRIDETLACARSITDGRYLYTRNFLPGPELRYQKYLDVSDIARLQRKANADGTLTPVQGGMFAPQPHEVLYDLQSDPWEIHNLAADPAQVERVSTLKKALFDHLIEVRDTMLCPEYELAQRSKTSTSYQWGQAAKPAELRAILQAADLATQPSPDPARLLDQALTGENLPSFWAAVGLRANPRIPLPPFSELKAAYPPTVIELAAACYLREPSAAAQDALTTFALSTDPHLRLQALIRIQDLGKDAAPFAATLEKALKGGTYETQCAAEVTLHLIDGRKLAH